MRWVVRSCQSNFFYLCLKVIKLFHKNHDRKARFEALYDEHYEKLLYFAYSILGNGSEAEDAVAEAFFSIWSRWNHLSEEKHIVAYVYASVRNNCLKARQRRQRNPFSIEDLSVTISVDGDSPELIMLSAESVKIIEDSINGLPNRCKIIFLMAKEQGMSYNEIGVLLDISPKTVQAQMVIALGRIREVLQKHNIEI